MHVIVETGDVTEKEGEEGRGERGRRLEYLRVAPSQALHEIGEVKRRC